MPVKTLYPKDAVPSGATLHRSLQDGGTAPTAATTGTGWVTATNAAGQSCLMVGGTEVARNAATWGTTLQPSAVPSTTLGDCWRSESAFTGEFANSNWVMTFLMRSVTAAYTGRFRLAIRIWKSPNANGSSATELTSGRVVSAATTASMTTTTDTTLTCTWTPGATKSLNNEYLFVNVGVEVTTAGSGTTTDMDFRVGSGSTLVTPNFSYTGGVAEGTATAADIPDAQLVTDVTVVPNTADAAALTRNAKLEFTGTDSNSHDVTYNVQIGTDSLFTANGAPAEIDSQNTHGGGGGLSSTTTGIAQSFTGTAVIVTKVRWELSRTTATGTLVAKLYAHSGTFGTTGIPTGPALATSATVDIATSVPGSYGLVDFNFSTTYRLTAGTKYVVAIEVVAITGVINAGINTGGHSGNYSTRGSGGWGAASLDDAVFSIHGAAYGSLLLDKLSVSDAGFVNTVSGGDTDPFTSGQKISFTVQSGDTLPVGTYYWRASGKHVGAVNWSVWSTTRSFTATDNDVSVVLNTANAASLTTTPTLEFTGTDSNGHDVTYEIRVGTDPDIGVAITIDSYESGLDAVFNFGNSTYFGVSQSFYGTGVALTKARFYLRKVGSPTASLTAYLYDATTGTDPSPTGSPLATSQAVLSSAISGSFGWVDFLFTDGYVPTDGQKYCIAINNVAAGDASNYYGEGVDDSTPTHSGGSAVWNGTSWLIGTFDILFSVKSGPPTNTQVLDKLSDVDSGFANTVSGGDTDPFTSGNKVSHTVASALAAGTYYWQVRARHVGGTWSAWTSTRSFTAVSNDVAVAEGGVTAADTPNTTANIFGASCAEGGATAADAPIPAPSTYAPWVGEGRYNQLSRTEEFDDARWTATFASVTPNAGTDPFGGNAADKLIPGTNNTTHTIAQTPHEFVPVNSVLDGSVYVKAVEYTWFFLGVVLKNGATAYSSFNLTASTCSFGAKIENVGNGWFRCSVTTSLGTGSSTSAGRLQLMCAPTSSSVFAGDGTSGVLIYGAQIACDRLLNYQAVGARFDGDVSDGSTFNVIAGVVAEGGATSADTPDGSVIASARVGYVGWVRFFVSVAGGGASYSDAVAEGSATAADTPSAKGTFATVVVEGTPTALDTVSGVQTSNASLAEGTVGTCTDTTSSTAVFAPSCAEGTATSLDTPSSSANVLRPSVAEGSATATDMPSAVGTYPGVIAEGTVGTATDTITGDMNTVLNAVIAEGTLGTCTDFPTATETAVASVAEGSVGTATDTSTAAAVRSLATCAEGTVGTCTDTPNATEVNAAFIAEGTATANDTPSTQTTFVAAIAEGSATSFDTPSAKATFAASLSEGTPTATDTCSTSATEVATCAEGTPTATDAPSATAILRPAVVEGTATALDTPTAGTNYSAVTCPEGTVGTALDTPNATEVNAASVAEGTPTAQDTPNVAAVFAASVAEVGTLLDTITGGNDAALAEGVSTAVDTPSAKAVFAPAVVEGTSSAVDTCTTSVVAIASVAEGTPTALDSTNALKTLAASDAEGTPTAQDTPSATAVMGAAVAEGSSTATDVPNFVAGGSTTGDIVEGTPTAVATQSSQAVFAGVIAEGSATAVDTPSAAPSTLVGSVAEGSSTAVDTCNAILIPASIAAVFENGAALDTPSAKYTTNAAVVETSNSADTPAAGVNYKAVTVVEGSATAVATQDWSGVTVSSIAEGSPTALDSQNANRTVAASVTEGSSTSVDVQTALANLNALIEEGTASAQDLQTAAAIWICAIAESATLIDSCYFEVPGRGEEREAVYDEALIIRVYAEPYRYVAIYTPLDGGEAVFTEVLPLEPKFTEPVVREPKYDDPEKRLVKV